MEGADRSVSGAERRPAGSGNSQLTTTSRDCLAGELAIKAKGETYLPRLEGQTDTEYAAYVSRAQFLPAASQVLEDCLSAAFKRTPEIQLPAETAQAPRFAAFLSDCDLAGRSFIDLARAIAVVFMVYGHAVDALLAPRFRSGFVCEAWTFQRGLTSCLFLLLSGFAFSIATVRHWPAPVCEVAAMVDALLWQWQPVLTRNAGRFDQISEAARKLAVLPFFAGIGRRAYKDWAP